MGNCYWAMLAHWRREVGLSIRDGLDEREGDFMAQVSLVNEVKNPAIQSSPIVTLAFPPALWGHLQTLRGQGSWHPSLCLSSTNI